MIKENIESRLLYDGAKIKLFIRLQKTSTLFSFLPHHKTGIARQNSRAELPLINDWLMPIRNFPLHVSQISPACFPQKPCMFLEFALHVSEKSLASDFYPPRIFISLSHSLSGTGPRCLFLPKPAFLSAHKAAILLEKAIFAGKL